MSFPLPHEGILAAREGANRCEVAVRTTAFRNPALVFGVVLAGSVSGSHAGVLDPAPVQDRPNVVVFMTDDQDCYSMNVLRPNGKPLMENVEGLLAREGVTFSRCYASLPLCCPSRATFFTGQHAHNHGSLQNAPPFGGAGALDQANTLAVWLDIAGYRTGHFGKYLNGYKINVGNPGTPIPMPPGWDEWHTTENQAFFDYDMAVNGAKVHYGNKSADYHTDVIAGKAVEFVASHAPRDEPMFLMVDFIAPHDDGNLVKPVPAPRHVGYFSGYASPKLPSFDEADVSDKPSWVQALAPITAAEEADIDERYRLRLESLLAVDEGIGAVMGALEASGELDDTLVIFWSDNGYHHGEHRIRDGKRDIYEESIHVPLIVRGPGFPKNVICDELVSNIDLAPTIVDLSGAKARRVMDGRSLLDLFSPAHGGMAWRKDLLIEDPLGTYYGVVTDHYVYVEHDNDQDGVVDDTELYNLAADACSEAPDPYELASKHRDGCYAALIADLSTRTQELSTCSGEGCW